LEETVIGSVPLPNLLCAGFIKGGGLAGIMKSTPSRDSRSIRRNRPRANAPATSRAILAILEQIRAKLHDLDQKLDHLIRNLRREGGFPAHFNHTLSEY